MNYKNLLNTLGFSPKENSSDIFFKEYQQADNYCIEIDFEKESIYYGDIIRFDNATTQNFSKQENFVVLECVDRLLSTGYKPESIYLEKAYPAGRGITKFLDILVYQENKPYLMIECKTYGEQFNNELKKVQKDGGQLFTYFQQDTKTELLMLYASALVDEKIVSEYKIIKIEEEFRSAGNVENVFKLWKGTYNDFKFWEHPPYEFKEKVFTKSQLIELTEKEGDGLFNKFAEVLRKHSVSDKPNAFSVIFNLFLAKLQDEQKKEDDELEFQWKENDDPVDFQIRLHNLHKEGSLVFLKKEIVSIEDKDFEGIPSTALKDVKKKFLKFTKAFDFKNVLDNDDFIQNQRVLKEIVQLIEKYRIRYPRKQKYLSEFFERLLTIGLKQEVGQYFTPPPITKFITRALPLPFLIEKELNTNNPELPAAIDYAAGSGHFLTEIMEEYQEIIDHIDTSKFNDIAQKKVAAWKINQYDWASTYIYGIEKDYRLVKVAKVGCYFYGDGLAQVVHGDGLDSFEKSKAYRGLLKDNANKPQFSIIVSNPPYAVNDCKDDLEYIYDQYSEKPTNFEIYNSLTYSSKEIECLFVERTKHLLKDGGVAGIILPSSIFSNFKEVYTKAREIILQYFEIIAVTELGSNTFMATGTNTVVLFLQKRNENDVERIKVNAYNNLEHYKKTKEERVTNGIETPMSKYLEHTEETEIDPEKFYYFVLNYWQKTVIVKTGTKEEEKRFLGYEYSNRRGHEGMQAIQRGKFIDQCTKLYNENYLDDATKASTYIYKAFQKKYPEIHESLKNNISCVNLVDMITFDREKFEKLITTTVEKKERIESRWDLVRLGDFLFENDKSNLKVGTAKDLNEGDYLFFTSGESVFKFNEYLVDNQNIYLSTGGNAIVKFYDGKAAYSTDTFVVRSNDEEKIKTKFIFYFLESIISVINDLYFKGVGLKHLQKSDFRNIQIPLPPKEIQEKIVSDIEVLEKKEAEAKEKIESLKISISSNFRKEFTISSKKSIGSCFKLSSGKMLSAKNRNDGYFSVYGGNGVTGFHDEFFVEEPTIVIGRVGEYCGCVHISEEKSWITDNALYIVSFSEQFNLKYLYYILKECNLNSYANKTAQPNISQSILNPVQIPVPPLSEQQQIVSEIEKIETQIAEFEQQLNEMPKLKESILKKYL